MAVHAEPEVVSVPIMPFGRGMRLDLLRPSAFIEDEYVRGPERWFEEWLYRHDFRPAWDNFLGKTIEQDGIDANTLNAYRTDWQCGFDVHKELSPSAWDWGKLGAFASKISKVKRIVRVPWPAK